MDESEERSDMATKPNAMAIYGYNEASEESWRNWAFALLTIAGADGVVSPQEMQWLSDNLCKTMGVAPEVLDAISDFDYKNSNLEEILPEITTDIPINHARALLYDAIRMARADGEYAPAERNAVRAAAVLMDIDANVAAAIEKIIDIEKSIVRRRLAYFEFDESFSFNTSSTNPVVATNPVFKTLYGVDKVFSETLKAYGRALISIAGADGEVSPVERNWLINFYARSVDIPEDIITLWDEWIENKAYKDIKLAEELPKIIGPCNAGRQLLYDSIRMSSSDHYNELERNAVLRAAELLKIDVVVMNGIEDLVKSELLANEMRRNIFRIGLPLAQSRRPISNSVH